MNDIDNILKGLYENVFDGKAWDKVRNDIEALIKSETDKKLNEIIKEIDTQVYKRIDVDLYLKKSRVKRIIKSKIKSK